MISKTTVLVYICVICAICGSNIPASAAALRQAQDRPNIVFILADDLGWRDTGFAGAEYYQTPHLDRLASEGMIFSAAYSGGPNCAPTRACLLSGTYAPRHQIFTPGGRAKGNIEYMRLLVPARDRKDKNLERDAEDIVPVVTALNPAFVCIPEILKPAGYTCARLGKWHLGPDMQGFDLNTSNGADGPDASHYGNVDVAEKLTDRALRFIEDNKSNPFFLYVAHWDVHTPHRARKDVVARHRIRQLSLPEAAREHYDPVYAGMIEAVDTSVGRIVKQIDALGLAENTLIVFSSDNGGLSSVSELAPLRAQKGSLFEGGTRVPTCVRWTGIVEAGSTCATPITSVDFLPTFTELAGGALPSSQPIDGTSIAPLLHGKAIAERSIFWYYPLYLSGPGLTIDLPGGKTYSWRGFPSIALRNGKWKMIKFFEDNRFALFDLEKDPGETRDLSESLPEIAGKFRTEIIEWQYYTDAVIPATPNPECVLD